MEKLVWEISRDVDLLIFSLILFSIWINMYRIRTERSFRISQGMFLLLPLQPPITGPIIIYNILKYQIIVY
jgi:hypothetical protein